MDILLTDQQHSHPSKVRFTWTSNQWFSVVADGCPQVSSCWAQPAPMFMSLIHPPLSSYQGTLVLTQPFSGSCIEGFFLKRDILSYLLGWG